jgi:hypothetical protein
LFQSALSGIGSVALTAAVATFLLKLSGAVHSDIYPSHDSILLVVRISTLVLCVGSLVFAIVLTVVPMFHDILNVGLLIQNGILVVFTAGLTVYASLTLHYVRSLSQRPKNAMRNSIILMVLVCILTASSLFIFLSVVVSNSLSPSGGVREQVGFLAVFLILTAIVWSALLAVSFLAIWAAQQATNKAVVDKSEYVPLQDGEVPVRYRDY